MKILMVVAYFPPEIGSAAHVYYDLARAFIKRGHEVYILTSYPRKFNLDKSDMGKEFQYHEKIDGIDIHRTKHFSMRDFPFFRGLEHFILPYQYFSEYKTMNMKFDICLMYIPPLPLYQLANRIKKYDGTPSILNYQDFHPQELIDVNYGGIKRNFIMIKLLEYMENKSYKDADHITVLSEGGIDYVTRRGANPQKVTHIYNGVNIGDIKQFRSKKNFKIKEGIENKFLVSYAGIISPFQGIDKILDVALELQDQKDIIFYIAGDGMIRSELEMRKEKENISNLKILPFQTRNEYFNIVNSSDISIVSLDERMMAPCLPGKIINLLSMEKPIIVIAPPQSETYQLIKKIGCGIVLDPTDIKGFKDAILILKNNNELRKEMAAKGFSFLHKNMNLDKNVHAYEIIFKSLM